MIRPYLCKLHFRCKTRCQAKADVALQLDITWPHSPFRGTIQKKTRAKCSESTNLRQKRKKTTVVSFCEQYNESPSHKVYIGPRSKVMAPNESPYMISYMSIIQMKSLSLIVFVILVKIAFMTSDIGPRSKVMAPNESPYMISYMSIIEMKSLSLVVFEIFAKIAF